MRLKITHLAIFFFAFIIFSSVFIKVYAQTDTPTPTPTSGPDTSALQQQIQDLENKISNLQGQERTLSSQISVMDNQITLTTLRINSTKQQLVAISSDISTTNKKITTLEDSLKDLEKVLLNRIVATYEVGTVEPLTLLLSSQNANDFFKRANYLRIAQAHDKRLIYDTQQAKNDYANQKNIFEDKKKKVQDLQDQLETYNTQLDSEKAAKQGLLTQTQGSEATYQQLLTQAKAQLASLAGFTAGAGVLSNQTSCDDWGCYYNQRDSSWASTLINGQSSGCNGACSVLSVGCTITSVAMVASHMGHRDISPGDIATSSTENFQVGTALLAYSINVKGVTITRHPTSTAGSSWPDSRINSLIDSDLPSGPVVVGMVVSTGTHFVVIKSGSNGNYVMNDPFTENGIDIPFTSHYSISSIYEVSTVSM